MNPLRITFLVYDSRSGSTLLARKMTEMLEDISVTPEIGFDTLFKKRNDGFTREQVAKLLNELFSSGDFRNFGVNPGALLLDLQALDAPVSTKDFAETALNLWRRSQANQATHIIVKNGSHIKYWPQIFRIWGGDVRMLHIYRDPRAVISSKLRTVRPYHPHESMAWGGALLAALRWTAYCRSMRAAQASSMGVLSVRYENLIASPDTEINRIAEFLGVRKSQDNSSSGYAIPVAEREIHQLVDAGRIEPSREGAWQRELAEKDRRVIEAVCRSEMDHLKYSLPQNAGWFAATSAILGATPGMLRRIAKHYWHLVNK